MSQCPGSGYGPDVAATKRKTPQKTIGFDVEPWEAAQYIARKRRERVPDVLRRALDDYVAEHQALIADDPAWLAKLAEIRARQADDDADA